MFESTWEKSLISGVVEGYLYGLYSAIFFTYIQYRASKLGICKSQNILFYSLCLLYILSIANFAVDVVALVATGGRGNRTKHFPAHIIHLYRISLTVGGICDFISQTILIYRCWIVWGGNLRIIIIPSIFAFACLVSWLAMANDAAFGPNLTNRDYIMTLISLVLSLTVNVVVTGLTVFRIVKVYWQVRPAFGDGPSGDSLESKLRSIIFVIIESRVPLFVIQLLRTYLTVVGGHKFYFIMAIVINQMLNGIAPTILPVRISMTLSHHNHDAKPSSVVEPAYGLHTGGSCNLRSISEVRNINIMGRESMHGIEIQQRNDIDIEEMEM